MGQISSLNSEIGQLRSKLSLSEQELMKTKQVYTLLISLAVVLFSLVSDHGGRIAMVPTRNGSF